MFIVDNMFTNVTMNFFLINIKSNNGWDEPFFLASFHVVVRIIFDFFGGLWNINAIFLEFEVFAIFHFSNLTKLKKKSLVAMRVNHCVPMWSIIDSKF